jgi:hypothetical protein
VWRWTLADCRCAAVSARSAPLGPKVHIASISVRTVRRKMICCMQQGSRMGRRVTISEGESYVVLLLAPERVGLIPHETGCPGRARRLARADAAQMPRSTSFMITLRRAEGEWCRPFKGLAAELPRRKSAEGCCRRGGGEDGDPEERESEGAELLEACIAVASRSMATQAFSRNWDSGPTLGRAVCKPFFSLSKSCGGFYGSTRCKPSYFSTDHNLRVTRLEAL